MKKVITLVTALTILFGTMVAVPHNENSQTSSPLRQLILKIHWYQSSRRLNQRKILLLWAGNRQEPMNIGCIWCLNTRIAGTRREPFLVLKEAMSLEIYLQTRSIIFACVLVPTRFGERIAIAIILQLALLLPPSVIARVVQLRQRLRGGRPMVHMAMRYK